MDRLKRHTSIVKELIHQVSKLGKRENDPIQSIVIEDDKKGHYLIFTDGWRGERRVYGPYLHLEVRKDGKVWLHNDGTDMEIALMLVKKGISQSDIVLAFHPPIVRPDTGFAVA